ncbi:MAG: hypothetical protein VW258_00665 [Thalassolituus sp.]
MTPFKIAHILVGAALLSPLAQAEIQEIPAEEMTESYIRDTTVIVRKQAPTVENTQRTLIRVSPLEDDFSEGESVSDSTAEIRQMYEAMPGDMTAQTEYEFYRVNQVIPTTPEYDPDRYANDAKLREVLGLSPNEAIDYNNLSNLALPTVGPDGETVPDGMTINPGSFQIVIPNTNGYPSESHLTPNGEASINVTPENITFQFNTQR